MTHKGFKHWTWECKDCGAKGKKPVVHSTAVCNGKDHMFEKHRKNEIPTIVRKE